MIFEELEMRAQRGGDRRKSLSGLPAGLPERRCGPDRRRLQLTEESIAAVEARLVALARSGCLNGEEEGSGWDKLIIPVK
jgi:hypothetical protein